jgi:hypothetical protein
MAASVGQKWSQEPNLTVAISSFQPWEGQRVSWNGLVAVALKTIGMTCALISTTSRISQLFWGEWFS